MDYVALKAEIDTGPLAATLAPMVTAGNDAGIADALNAKNIVVKGKLETHYIRQYLMLVDLLIPIETTVTPTCIAATRAMDVFPIFDLSDTTILAKFTQVIDGLVDEPLVPDFNVVHRDTILGLADIKISRAEQVLGHSITHADVAVALRGGV